MKNNNSEIITLDATTLFLRLRFGCKHVRALRQGYEDVRNNQPPSATYYDHENVTVAGAYENGRINAINIRSAGLQLAEWPLNLPPTTYTTARQFANTLVGEATLHRKP